MDDPVDDVAPAMATVTVISHFVALGYADGLDTSGMMVKRPKRPRRWARGIGSNDRRSTEASTSSPWPVDCAFGLGLADVYVSPS